MPAFGCWLTGGCTQPSHVPAMIACGLGLSPALLRRPETTVMCCLNGSNGFRICGSSNAVPVSFGCQRAWIAPCGKYVKPMRGFGAAAVLASAVRSGNHRVEQRQADG